MKNQLIIRTVVIAAALVAISCTREIDVDFSSVSPQIVIEGSITDQPGPYYVKLTKTVDFTQANNYPPVSKAVVVISDDQGIVDTLTETTPGLYQTNTTVGKAGVTYKLQVIAEGKEYYSFSTMPNKVNLDTMDFTVLKDPDQGDHYAVIPRYLDPIELGNSYRFYFSAKGAKEKIDKSYQVNNDDIGNGKVNQQPFFSNDDVFFLKGDTVKVVMLCIDRSTYNYFYTLSQLGGGGPDGGATPTNPPNNILGNQALGLFSAHTVQEKSAVVE